MTIVRSLDAGGPGIRAFAASPYEVPDDPREARIEALEAEVAALREARASAKASAEERARAAREEGYEEGLEAATHDHEARDAAIVAAARAAGGDFGHWLGEMEGSAALIAYAGLAKLFGPHGVYQELVTAAIAGQVAQLRREAVVRVRVSAQDFEQASIAALVDIVPPGADIAVDPGLERGGCILELRVGEIDIAPEGQWQKLSALLLGAVGEDRP